MVFQWAEQGGQIWKQTGWVCPTKHFSGFFSFPRPRAKKGQLKQPAPAAACCSCSRRLSSARCAPADTPAARASETGWAEELLLQHSPKIVVLAQLRVSRLQHGNEDKRSRHGNYFFSENCTQATFPHVALTSCNNIVCLRSVPNLKGTDLSSASPWPVCLPYLAPALTYMMPRSLSSQNKSSQNTEEKTYSY